MRRRNALLIANIAFVTAIVLHGADHIRQGTGSLTPEVVWGGAVLAAVGFATLPFTLRGDPRAAPFAAIVGLYTAVAVSASHLAPHWSAFSDSYPEIHADATSWVVVLLEIAGALLLAAVAVRELRRASNGAPRAAVVAGSGRST